MNEKKLNGVFQNFFRHCISLLCFLIVSGCSAAKAPEVAPPPLAEFSAQQAAKLQGLIQKIERLSISTTTIAMTEPALFVIGCINLETMEAAADEIKQIIGEWRQRARSSDLSGAEKNCSQPYDSWMGVTSEIIESTKNGQ